jgi:lipoate---protein ligase
MSLLTDQYISDMTLNICEDYNLPDRDLYRSGNTGEWLQVWKPTETMIIIGKGSDPDLELISESIIADQIPVIRRNTGGCSVIISPSMFVVSLSLTNQPGKKNNEYFDLFNDVLLRALQKTGVKNLDTAGISDITLNKRKVVGSAIYRNKDAVFYHAIINNSGSIDLMERYLKIPPRQPDYRKDRSHDDFVTSFKAEGFELDVDKFKEALQTEWLWHF